MVVGAMEKKRDGKTDEKCWAERQELTFIQGAHNT